MDILHAILTLAASILLLAACSAESPPPQLHSQREAAALITQTEASYRKGVVTDPSYRIAISLDEDGIAFGGETVMRFNYLGGDAPLNIDFGGGEVLDLSLNGEPIAFEYNNYFITLPAGSLAPGPQELRITTTHPYSQNGSGLYRYVDPEDGRVYLYTDFEAFDANRMFPHFDQPDLKARFELSVRAPASWQVVSTTRENSIVADGDYRVWEFPSTELISSYVFSLHAGEYVVFEDPEFRYPLRLFARQSIAQYVNAEEWLQWTRQGFDFFDEYFALPYPFKKYDQLLVPDYNSGAMENVAAVTFNEFFITRGEATRRERMGHLNTIYHEMAHMWFGDITTMAWWNGLWLNESFATVMAYVALEGATEFKESWQEFFIGDKQWAYGEDQLVTTHPIELPVADTNEAFVNFDGITYGKGASVLKQLQALLGEDVFRRGVRAYLATNAWSNTELDDFMGAMATAADRNLDDWTQRWLYQAGLNSIEASFHCEAGKITSMQLLQTAPEDNPILRQQRTQLALYQQQDGELQLERTIDLLFEGARTEVPQVVDAPCPDFVYPNYEDWAYIKVALDPKSVSTAREHINGLKDPMLRTMVWYDLYIMMQDARLTLSEYLDILLINLPREINLSTAADQLWNLRSGFAYLHQIPAGAELLPRYAAKVEPLLWNLVLSSSGDARQQWLMAYIDTANNDAAWSRLEQLLGGKIELDGFTLDQDQRWQIVRKLSEFRRPGYGELAAAETARDGSALGAENGLKVKVLSAEGEEKWEWLLQAVAADEIYTLQRSRNIQEALFPYSSQRKLMAPFADKFIALLPTMSANHDVVFHDKVTRYMMPRLCSMENVQRLKQAAKDYADLNPAIVRGLRVGAQLDERCVNIGRMQAASQDL